MKKILATILAVSMIFTLEASVMATDDSSASTLITNVESETYYDGDTMVEELTFIENEEAAAVIKRTFNDGSFEVEAINGEDSIIFEGKNVNRDTVIPQISSARDVTYPIYTPYYYVGYDDYSQNGTAITVATLAALLAASTGVGASVALNIATELYGLLGGQIGSDLYFRTYRYYATLDNGPWQPFIWYTKLVTYTYSDAARTNIIAGPVTQIYESNSPM